MYQTLGNDSRYVGPHGFAASVYCQWFLGKAGLVALFLDLFKTE
jgi:hypothetical protein